MLGRKNFVMAQRIVEKVKQGIEIDRLFISTFTKKAASELRMRLERDLKKRVKRVLMTRKLTD